MSNNKFLDYNGLAKLKQCMDGKYDVVVEITQDNYDNLSTDEKNKDITYYITDSRKIIRKQQVYSKDSSIAENISYENNTSGLSADNVQDALDELNNKMPFIILSSTQPTDQAVGSEWDQIY